MTNFLMRFEAYRSLVLRLAARERDYEDAQATISRLARENQKLEELAAKAEAKAEAMENKFLAQVEERVIATEKVADFHSRLRFGKSIFNAEPDLPAPEVDYSKMQTSKEYAGDVAKRRERDFWTKEYPKVLREQANGNPQNKAAQAAFAELEQIATN